MAKLIRPELMVCDTIYETVAYFDGKAQAFICGGKVPELSEEKKRRLWAIWKQVAAHNDETYEAPVAAAAFAQGVELIVRGEQ